MRICKYEGCPNKLFSNGWCAMHNSRVRRHGLPDKRPPRICKKDGCDVPQKVKGWCQKHYERVRRTGSPDLLVGAPRICTIDRCDKPHRAKGWCGLHYQRNRKYGSPHTVQSYPPICAVDGCNNKTEAKGWCCKHYYRVLKHGSPHTVLRTCHKQPGEKKTCRECKAQLVVGESWTKSGAVNGTYICRSCCSAKHKKARKKQPAHIMFLSIKNRCRRRGLLCDLTEQHLQELMDATPACPVLGMPLLYGGGNGHCLETASLDRFDPSQGYVIGNVSIMSWRANALKKDATLAEVRKLSEWMTHVEETGDFVPMSDKQAARLAAQIMSAQP